MVVTGARKSNFNDEIIVSVRKSKKEYLVSVLIFSFSKAFLTVLREKFCWKSCKDENNAAVFDLVLCLGRIDSIFFERKPQGK
jgi:glycerol-3-phosphate acyltransferase PlsY